LGLGGLGGFVKFWVVLISIFGIAMNSAYGVGLDGKRIKVKGLWTDGNYHVYKLKIKNPDADTLRGRIRGRIVRINHEKHRLWIGPVEIQWSGKTKFKGLTQSDLEVGFDIKISGVSSSPGILIAKSFKPGPNLLDDNIVSIDATASLVRKKDNHSTLVSLLGVPIQIPAGLSSNLRFLTRRQNDRRPGDQAFIEFFGSPLIIGGEIGFNPRYREDFRLDPDRNDDVLRLDHNAQLELFYSWHPEMAIFIEGQGNIDIEVYREGRGRSTESSLRRGDMWVFWGDLFDSGVSIQIGRQNFQEPREWWWDQSLDGVRLYYNRPFVHFELGLTQQLAPVATDENFIDPDEDDVLRLLSKTRWEWISKHFASLFFLYQHDHSRKEKIGTIVKADKRDEFDGDVTWAGFRSQGVFDLFKDGQLEYWVDTAWVRGKETAIDFDRITDDIRIVDTVDRNKFEGWAVDTGIIFETSLPGDPAFTFGYAIGSPEFRQTGIQNNNNRFRGVDRFRYYGELFRPELANMEIWTVATGFPLLSNSSVEFVYHNYQQVDARPFLRRARVADSLNGVNTSIGQEWDIVFGIEETENIEMEFVFAVFRAGSAYGDLEGRTALNINFKFNYNF